jgi:putative membrane protein insertion efficiency factor
MTATLLRWVCLVLSTFLIVGVRFYQAVLRPVLPSVCRFEPSCSEYFILAVRKHGPVRGACKGVGRICRCNPWNAGGYDPP